MAHRALRGLALRTCQWAQNQGAEVCLTWREARGPEEMRLLVVLGGGGGIC